MIPTQQFVVRTKSATTLRRRDSRRRSVAALCSNPLAQINWVRTPPNAVLCSVRIQYKLIRLRTPDIASRVLLVATSPRPLARISWSALPSPTSRALPNWSWLVETAPPKRWLCTDQGSVKSNKLILRGQKFAKSVLHRE